MAHGNPLLDDMAKVMTGMMDAAQSAGEEFVAEMDLARRDEIEALKELVRASAERISELEKRIEELEDKAG